ncbi:MAG TPA: hypothetical protein PKL97_09295, partial [Candidatus Omnitrophota bacterium]|nr:hypothetical protein [Candidatus Omnitrophota bacterium]
LASVLEAKKLHIDLLRLNIRELNIEIRGDGKSNLALLKTDGKKESPPDSGGASGQSVFSPGGEEGKSPFYIRKFVLTLRKVNYRDKSNLVPISITDDVRLEDAVFFGLDQPGEIPDLIVLNLLAQTKFGDLGLDPAEIGRAVRATAQAAAGPGEETPEGDDLKDAVETVKDEFSAFWDEVKAKFRKNGKTPAEGSDPGKG